MEEGRIFIEKCLQLQPGNARAYKNLGIYYDKVGNAELAANHFNKERELGPDIELGTQFG